MAPAAETQELLPLELDLDNFKSVLLVSSFSRRLRFFSPASHKWQNLHETPISHPAVWKNAHGLQMPSAWPTEPELGNSSLPSAGAAGGGGGGGTGDMATVGASFGGAAMVAGATAGAGAEGPAVARIAEAMAPAGAEAAAGAEEDVGLPVGAGSSPSAHTVATEGSLPEFRGDPIGGGGVSVLPSERDADVSATSASKVGHGGMYSATHAEGGNVAIAGGCVEYQGMPGDRNEASTQSVWHCIDCPVCRGPQSYDHEEQYPSCM